MSEEKTEVALVSLPATPAELEAAFINDEYIDGLITSIREKALPVVGDLNKAAGRRVYISMAATVRSTKAMIDEAGKNLVADMKKRPALVDASRKKVRDALDDLAVEIRKPVTDWEAEQDRIKAKAARDAEQAKLERQAAIEAEQHKAKEEADRIRLESEQKEQARLAEEKRIADEAAKRAKDTEHRRTVNRTAVADLIKEGIPDEFARKCVEAVARMKIKNMTINY